MEKFRQTNINVTKTYADGRVVQYGKKKVAKTLYKNNYINDLLNIKKIDRVNSFDSDSSIQTSPNSIFPSENSIIYEPAPPNRAELFQVNYGISRDKGQLIDRLQNYPFYFAKIMTLILLISSLAKIALQIVLLTNKTPLNTVSAGIWSGAYGLLICIINLILFYKRKYNLYQISVVISLFGIFIFVAVAVVNSYCLSLYDICSSCSYDSNYLGVNITLMILGVVSFSICILYVFKVQVDMV
ncbi:unnamed protein product [Brachionus calyciflorus]|uniref:Uncharacterized protein n=1 Tax=Brachionus calyciflorus TaxID=104777 RepID=A0A813R134_9BILA|nr:unnamed protein product [Brachionus calyciflorus]